MLTGLGLRNFKAFGDEMQEAPLSKITLIYGPNSGGKSSIIQALLLLKQSLDSTRQGFKRELMPVGNVDLGSFPALIYKHETERELEIKIQFDVTGSSYIANVHMTFADPTLEEGGLIALAHQIFDRDNKELLGTKLKYQSGDSLHDGWDALAPHPLTIAIDNDDGKEQTFLPQWKFTYERALEQAKRTKAAAEEGADIRQINQVLGEGGLGRGTSSPQRKQGIAEQHKHLETARESIDELIKSIEEPHFFPRRRLPLTRRFGLGARSSAQRRLSTLLYRRVQEFLKLTADREQELSERERETSDLKFTERNWYGELSDLQLLRRIWARVREEALPLQNVLVELTQVEIPEAYESFLKSINHQGPLRDQPERLYITSGGSRESTGIRGEFTPHILYHKNEVREAVNYWFNEFDIPYKLGIKSLGDVELAGERIAVELTDSRTNTPVTIADVGFGISCILPVIVEGVASPKNTILCIEQPELHLHPRLQASVTDLMIDTIADEPDKRKQWIVETHSELLILRLQRRIREGKISPDDVSVLYVDPNDDSVEGSAIIKLRLDENGDFTDDWPDGFFDEGFNELMAEP